MIHRPKGSWRCGVVSADQRVIQGQAAGGVAPHDDAPRVQLDLSRARRAGDGQERWRHDRTSGDVGVRTHARPFRVRGQEGGPAATRARLSMRSGSRFADGDLIEVRVVAGFSRKFHPVGTTTLGTRRTAEAAERVDSSPIRRNAAGGGLSRQFRGRLAKGKVLQEAGVERHFDGHVPPKHLFGLDVDEQLQHPLRDASGDVDDGNAGTVPSPARQSVPVP